MDDHAPEGFELLRERADLLPQRGQFGELRLHLLDAGQDLVQTLRGVAGGTGRVRWQGLQPILSAVPAGYRHPAYAASLVEFGDPLPLASSGGTLLARTFKGARDAMGPYPVFGCTDWTAVGTDLAALTDVVSVTLVTDPFGDWTVELLDAAFPDRRVPFKEHYVVDLGDDPVAHASDHHKKYVRRGLRRVRVEAADPVGLHADFVRLYSILVARHGITGVSAFSPDAFARQLCVPGIVAFTARAEGEIVGATLWYVDAGVAHWHLAAYSPQGYRLDASYALLATALERFADDGLRFASLGAGAGLSAEPTDGLSRFKAGWATGTRTVHLCGRILDPDRYRALGGPPGTAFFPAYRADSMAQR
jgi:hypothetical protein